jgi:hypothetical protein
MVVRVTDLCGRCKQASTADSRSVWRRSKKRLGSHSRYTMRALRGVLFGLRSVSCQPRNCIGNSRWIGADEQLAAQQTAVFQETNTIKSQCAAHGCERVLSKRTDAIGTRFGLVLSANDDAASTVL